MLLVVDYKLLITVVVYVIGTMGNLRILDDFSTKNALVKLAHGRDKGYQRSLGKGQ